MRDLLIAAIVLLGCAAALRRPWIGVMLWTWLSLMNPHKYAYGFAQNAQFAALTAACTLAGMLATRDKTSPFKGPGPVLLVAFTVWLTISWLAGLDPANDYEQWKKVIKINGMVFVSLALLSTRQHIYAFVWTCALSLGLLGAKGGAFTLLHGGNFRVWGPGGSFIEDNNAFALALVMTIPLLRFLQMQVTQRALRHALTGSMLLLAASALGSHSRGGLLAMLAMTFVLWWRGRSRFLGGIVIVVAAVLLVSFMPAEWTNRMDTINDYEEDRSALGRFSAWWVGWGIAKSYIAGVGFNTSRPELFLAYSPYGIEFGTPTAHSIYFQVLGHHGFIGLILFVMLWVVTFVTASRVRKAAATIPQAQWCRDLAGMCQVSLIGYAVGGAFLSLAYFDLPYNILLLMAVTQSWVKRKGWETEPEYKPGWLTIPGLATAGAPR
ncbi:MAG: putative O-glycosylation ligase, exosortase A system-associated [Burkholderiaceae bacterium]|nr:putative O-glycosylation ligase, exosortase A system-associated [Burkholderiaceae bacterium]